MNQKQKLAAAIIIVILAGVIAACWWQNYGKFSKAERCYKALGGSNMSNPASSFCKCMGGKTKIGSDQKGLCAFDDMSFDEWGYFKSMNPDDNTYENKSQTDDTSSSAKTIEEEDGVKEEFSYPYALSWTNKGIEFSLEKIYLGKAIVFSEVNGINEEIKALILTVKTTGHSNTSLCNNSLNLKRVINENGDTVDPSIFRYNTNGDQPSGEDRCSSTAKFAFPASDTDTTFDMTTIDLTPNILFTVNLLETDGEPILQLEKNTEEEGFREIQPYYADVLSCHNSQNNDYLTTGPSSAMQNWFVYGGCPTAKNYNVEPGKEMIFDVRTDDILCSSCVCNYPIFSLYEYKDNGFVKIKDFNLKNGGGVSEKVYYTPSSDKIKITAPDCFYLNVFQEGESE